MQGRGDITCPAARRVKKSDRPRLTVVVRARRNCGTPNLSLIHTDALGKSLPQSHTQRVRSLSVLDGIPSLRIVELKLKDIRVRLSSEEHSALNRVSLVISGASRVPVELPATSKAAVVAQ